MIHLFCKLMMAVVIIEAGLDYQVHGALVWAFQLPSRATTIDLATFDCTTNVLSDVDVQDTETGIIYGGIVESQCPDGGFYGEYPNNFLRCTSNDFLRSNCFSSYNLTVCFTLGTQTLVDTWTMNILNLPNPCTKTTPTTTECITAIPGCGLTTTTTPATTTTTPPATTTTTTPATTTKPEHDESDSNESSSDSSNR